MSLRRSTKGTVGDLKGMFDAGDQVHEYDQVIAGFEMKEVSSFTTCSGGP